MAGLRRTRGVLVIGAAALTVGCGAQDSAKHAASDARNAIDPVAQAAAATSAQDGGIAMTIKGDVTTAGQEVPVDASGVVDRDGKRGTLSMTTSIAGQTVKMDEVIVGKVIYMTSELFKDKLPGGKQWLKLDLTREAAKLGIDLDALGGGSATQDPAAMLDYLKGAGTSRTVGTETVNGTRTTRYHVDVDLRKAAAKSADPDAKASVEKLIKVTGTATLPIDVWVDAKHLVRREKVAYDATVQGQKSSFDMTIDLTKFGVDVDAQAPSADDVVDFAALTGTGSGGTSS